MQSKATALPQVSPVPRDDNIDLSSNIILFAPFAIPPSPPAPVALAVRLRVQLSKSSHCCHIAAAVQRFGLCAHFITVNRLFFVMFVCCVIPALRSPRATHPFAKHVYVYVHELAREALAAVTEVQKGGGKTREAGPALRRLRSWDFLQSLLVGGEK